MSRSRCLPPLALSAALALPALHAQTTIASSLAQTVRDAQASPMGQAETSKVLQLAISLPLRNESALDALLAQINDATSAQYHKYLTPEQFAAQFAPSEQDYDAVIAWAQAKGLTVTRTTPNRRVIDVQGSIGTINRAFRVSMNYFRETTPEGNGRTFYAPDREPTVDSPVPLLAISGLDNATPKRAHYRKGSTAVDARSTTQSENAIAHISGSGPGNTYTPSDMRAAYYGNGPLTGAGQTVAIFSYDGYITNDIQIYYNNIGASYTVPVKNVLVNGYSGACFGFTSSGQEDPTTCDDGEQILDIANVIGMAPGLSQVLFYEGNSSTDVLNQMATDNIAKVISSSWGGGDFGSASEPIFKQFQAQGITYVNATGDSGAFNSQTYAPPSVSANITQVGGTDLTTSSAGGAWSGETGWSYSGGGYVTGTPIPTYQQAPGVINSSNGGSTTLRNAPDVAAEANFDNTTVINGQFESGYGGTSYATPRWAGIIALANQQAAANGVGTVGFFNPKLYTIGTGSSYATMFHDITSGNNKPTAGTGNGFNAVTGYDLVTGWGSPIGPALINNLAGASTTAPGYSISASPSSLSVGAGASGTSTITVTNTGGFTGSVALTASGLPTGVTASFSPSSTTTTSTLTFNVASTATAGTYTVTVTGTSGSTTHTTSVSLTIIAAAGTQTQVIGNPGFENGTNAAPWTLTAGVLCSNSTCSGETAHSGSWFAWLDGYGRTHTDTATQTVTLPAGKTAATLSFYLHIDTAETTTAAANDVLSVQVYSTSGALLGTLATFSNLNKATGYQQHTYNMASYIGKSVVLKFTGTENSSRATSFVLDEVTLTAQ